MSLLRFAPLALVLILASGCDSGEPDDPTPAAPTFEIVARSVTLDDLGPGFAFFVTPSTNVTLNFIELRNPLGEGGRTAVQNLNLLGGDREPLQEEGTGFPKVSGNWRFRFAGYITSQGPNAVFDVTTVLPVSARERSDTPAE